MTTAPAPAPALPGFEIRAVALADVPEWAEYALLPEVQRHTSTWFTSAADLRPLVERCLSADAGAPVLFSVRSSADGRLVANVGFHTISALNCTAELTYVVRPECWGQGLGTQLCEAAVRWGFEQRGWVRIQATVLEPNRASIRVLEKCSFALEGRLRNLRIVRGRPSDFLLYARVPQG